MSHAALTARYRPQSFAEVAGQTIVKSILSRAALEDKIAPAYIFSGTRGVGKTTLARIFAKALNCRSAPAAEPCNQCDQCRAITQGNAVDVVEMDGASNTGVDDVRKLKEVVGYAPMEGRYKIFIIDEAHMLSKNAFNALLKTLEEPPQRVSFILATTEPHKFPATIISRCQHYVFKSLSEEDLIAHIRTVLQREGVEGEDEAVRLLARRGSGSVRDSMSLLDQVLALGEGALTESSTRRVLGLAGAQMQNAVLAAIRDGDCLGLSVMLRELLDQGLDMGFFLRELSSMWRNLFMLRQSGKAALSTMDLSGTEAEACFDLCQGFSLQHIHACWQMTLEGQRRVLNSLEPAPALELLLLNLAMLPRLLSLENLSALGQKNAAAQAAVQTFAPRTTPRSVARSFAPPVTPPVAPRAAPQAVPVSPESSDSATSEPAVAARPERAQTAVADSPSPAPLLADAPAGSHRPREALLQEAGAGKTDAKAYAPVQDRTAQDKAAEKAEKKAAKAEIMQHPLVLEVVRQFDASYLDHGKR
ncbi:MAG: DNA polymerase III subunit gamma/tau [Desulfovibrio sp.]|nr:DNA polymerase III subunit gamma/tau [Desulfovibrio sp.]